MATDLEELARKYGGTVAPAQKAPKGSTAAPTGSGGTMAPAGAQNGPTPSEMALEGMPWWERGLAGIGMGAVNAGRGVRQLAAYAGLGDPAAVQAEIDEAKVRDAALASDGMGMAGNIAGTVASMYLPGGVAAQAARLIPKAVQTAVPAAQVAEKILRNTGTFLNAPKGVIPAVAAGATQGAVAPVASDESRLDSIMWGGAAGGALPAVVAAGKTAKALTDPFRASGRQQIAARALEHFATDVDQIRNVKPQVLVPGSAPTLSQATLDPGIANLERTLQATDVQTFGAELNRRMVEQNAARLAAVRGVAGDEAALEAAKQARKVTTQPLYAAAEKSTAEVDTGRVVRLIDRMLEGRQGQRDALRPLLQNVREGLFEAYPLQQRGKDAWDNMNALVQKMPRMSSADYDVIKDARAILHRVKTGKIDQNQALEHMKALTPKGKTAADALDEARQYLKTPDYVLKTSPQQLLGQLENIGDKIDAKGPNGLPVNEAAVRELTVLKKALEAQVAKAVPEAAQARQTFRTMSRPVNQMEVGQEILRRSTSSLEKSAVNDTGGAAIRDVSLYPEGYARALDGGRQLVGKATGFKRNKGLESVFDPAQMDSLHAVRDDLARAVSAQGMGKSLGSPTVQYMTGRDMLRQVMGPLGMPQGWAESALADTFAGRGLSWAMKAVQPRVTEELSTALMDPQRAAQLLAQLPADSPVRALLREQIVPRLSTAGAGATIAGNN